MIERRIGISGSPRFLRSSAFVGYAPLLEEAPESLEKEKSGLDKETNV